MTYDHNRCEWMNVSSGTGLPRLSWTNSREPQNGYSSRGGKYLISKIL